MDVSDYDNVEANKENISISEDIELIISDIVSVVQTDDPVFYCPFCVLSFARSPHLRKHLSSSHIPFLQELLTRSISLDKCPFCSAKFFSHHLVARHSLTHHSYVIFEAFFVKVRSKVQCLFCNVVVDKSCMSQHVSSLHAFNFYDWFIGKFCVKFGGVAGAIELPAHNQLRPSTSMDIEILNEQLETLHMSFDKPVKSILKNKKKGKDIPSRLPVRRELRFEEGKENVQPHSSRKSHFLLTQDSAKSALRRPRSGSGSSWNTALKKCSFQCGKCSLCFATHTQLVLHVKNEHKKMYLQPMYQCALCGAKFYRSSYLNKHSLMHSLTKQ